ncbi:hypothetical protein PAJ34TS1_55000 [Paenibacillus azoreducens]|uniref:Uncharacterized protein n=1 Tax=Paenibacillus azoreducens TaxID=116718 RepID=A0A919YGE4_9BACL|nr:hypothetical protein J34TS1_29900 [Paenibacillus azoreducens]
MFAVVTHDGLGGLTYLQQGTVWIKQIGKGRNAVKLFIDRAPPLCKRLPITL